jgi:pimeloyl-ACP methyl ester carboxylesterase
MTEATLTRATTSTLAVPGATITYDVRANDSSAQPPLFLLGSPMGAGGFATLAGHFPDRTVVTYDPRGSERSPKADDLSESTPQQHADDIHRVIEAVGRGRVDMFASSGGAVNALALVAAHPEDVRILVAHEPPAASLLPDREGALAMTRDIHATYLRSGRGLAMAKFIQMATHKGPITAEYLARPDPDPQMFGFAAEDDGARNDPLVGHNMISGSQFEPDFDALRRARTRIVIGVGAASVGELAHRGGEAVAARLGVSPVIFPSGHRGFVGDEHGQPGEPDAFAAKLREVLAANAPG